VPIPPKAVQNAARVALERRRSVSPSNRGGTLVGVARARDLSGGRDISFSTIKRMRSFFARHNTPAERRNRRIDVKGKASVAWGLWGGNAGRTWANSVFDREERNAKR
tara:strand:- start:2457 stop:2780 length:324 start_codon:yes stop_codon:yes gene_type:complete